MKPLAFTHTFEANYGKSVELSPLLRRLTCNNPSAFTFKGTNSFIIGQGSVAIVDPGPDDDHHLAALLHAVRGETVSHILITHSHMDHSPLARKLQLATGGKIVGVPLVAESLSGLRLDASVDAGFAPDVIVGDGDVIEGRAWRVQCVFTPGHLANHMAYALPEERSLIVGDHVMAWATSVIAPPDGHMGDYLASLRKLLMRTDDIYHPAHGPSRRKPLGLVRGILAHRKMREEAIFERVKLGDLRIERIVERLYADVAPALHAAAGLSTRAHLYHLIEQGKVLERDDDEFVVAALNS